MQDRGQDSQGGSDGVEDRIHTLEVAQATQAATQAGAVATLTATQAGATATSAAAQAGTVAMVVAGSVSLVVGIFLGLAIARGHQG